MGIGPKRRAGTLQPIEIIHISWEGISAFAAGNAAVKGGISVSRKPGQTLNAL